MDAARAQVGRALYQAAGELGMPVGVMAFAGLPPQLRAIRNLLSISPSTKLIIDHVSFTPLIRCDHAGHPDEAVELNLDAVAHSTCSTFLCPCSTRINALFH